MKFSLTVTGLLLFLFACTNKQETIQPREEGITESVNLDDLITRLPIKPGLFEFNLDVMAERGFLTLLRGNRVALGPRLRALVGR